MATEKKQYVYRLMKAKCSCGDQKFEQYLNLTKDHGVTYHDNEYPLMNANDHIAGENILTFGRCTSITNPGGTIAEGIANIIVPGIGGALLQTAIGCKCEPMTITPWINVDEDYFIDGVPALTVESVLPCYYGGIISIVLEKIQRTDSTSNKERAEDKDKEEQLPSEVQEKIDSFTDKKMTNRQSRADEELEKIFQKNTSELTLTDRRVLAKGIVLAEQNMKARSVQLKELAAANLKQYNKAFFNYEYDKNGILSKVTATKWFEAVQSGFEGTRQDIVQFLGQLSRVPGANAKETIENLDALTNGELKRSIYHCLTFCAENGIKEKIEKLYGLQPAYYRPVQKFAVNNVLSHIPSEWEGYVINNLAGGITKGLLGFNYDEENDCYYTTEGSLQNAFGFGPAIDEMAPLLGMDLYHEDIVFEKGDKEYLIELWKGEYGWGVTSGGEVGVYTRSKEEADANPRVEGENNFDIYYDCAADEEQLHIITTMYDMSRGKEHMREICTRDTASYADDDLDYWNLNFRSFDAVDKEDIAMEITIEGDQETINAINGFITNIESRDKYVIQSITSNSISFTWRENNDH